MEVEIIIEFKVRLFCLCCLYIGLVVVVVLLLLLWFGLFGWILGFSSFVDEFFVYFLRDNVNLSDFGDVGK